MNRRRRRLGCAIAYLLRDEFTTALPAGSVNGTNAEPGPGVRTVVDTESKLSIAPGVLTFAGGKAVPSYNDPQLSYASLSRVAGRMGIFQVTLPATDTYQRFGFSYNGSNVDHHGIITFDNVGQISEPITGLIGLYTATSYKIAIALRTNGCHYYIKGGAFTNWTLLFIKTAGDLANFPIVYPVVFNHSSANIHAFIRIPLALWLPSPLLSDGMGSTFGTSDGLGHGEGEQASTQEKVTNGTFASDIANWATVLGAGGGTIAWDAGTIKFTQGGVSASMYAGQSISTVPGVTYTFSVSVTTNGIYTRLYVGTSLNGTELGTTSYAGSGTKTITFTASTYITYLTLVDANSATNISNWDNATCKVTTPATVLGAGGSGLIWNTAGTWATAAGVVANTPVLGVELFTDPGLEATYTAGLCDSLVVSGGSPTLAQSADVHGGAKAQQFTATARYNSIRQAMPAGARLANTWYQASLWSKRTAGAGNGVYAYLNGSDIDRPFSVITSAAYIQQTITFKINAALSYQRFALIDANDAGSYDTVIVDDFSYKLLPISTLITNQLLSTTDVLAEMVISAYTLGSQVGIVQSDRPFAFKANANAAAGQNVIVLKGVTNAIPDTDTITIKHPVTPTTYTIASVSALSGGIQTITLDTNLVEAVSVDDWVGVDWASWNGVMWYLNGSGNLDTVQILAGVYSSINSSTKAFSAGARLIPRIIGTEARIFYNEALIYTGAGTINATCLAGQYFGLMSTLAANTISSFVAYDTGNKTNAHATLDRYSRD